MLHRHIQKNIAFKLPYTKIEKTVTQFLTPDQYNRLIWHLSDQPDSSMGPRNLIIIMLHITAKQDFVEVITA